MPSTRPARAGALLTAILVLSACDAGAGPSGTMTTGATASPAASAATQSTPGASPPASSAPSTGTPIHIVKDCSTFNGVIPSYCEISGSDYTPIPVGARVNYLGPLLDNQYFLSSNVLIDDAHGNTATGYCIFDARPTENRGFCAFSAGSGALAGFTAIFKVSIDAIGAWHLDGESYGTAPSPGPS
jgi:hypothetical protein